MSFLGKNEDELTEADLAKLVDDKFEERDTVEYKRDMYGGSDDERREMLKDISAMANHMGGHILIGIDADRDGIATKLVGVDPENQVERITSCCLDNLEKRIMGLHVRAIPLCTGGAVLAISVPQSANGPHMVTFKGLNQFWKRHGKQKDKMSLDEIGQAFERRTSGLNRLERFRFTRQAQILELFGSDTRTVLSAAPLFLSDQIVFDVAGPDLRELVSHPPHVSPGYGISCGQAFRTLNGIRADQHSPYSTQFEPSPAAYIELFSNGYVEYSKKIKEWGQSGKYFAGKADVTHIIEFANFVGVLYEKYLPMQPLVAGFTILNARGIWLAVSRFEDDDKMVKWRDEHLNLGDFYIDDPAVERNLLAKRICDRLWQAFNRDGCSFFDQAGSFLLK